MDKWKTICSQALLDTKWVKVRKDAVKLPNGQHIDDFYAITINEAAAIVALDDYGNIILKKGKRSIVGIPTIVRLQAYKLYAHILCRSLP